MASLCAGEFAGVLESQEAFVQQHRGIEQRIAAAIAQLRARLAAQVVVGNRKQPLTRGLVASVRALDQ